MPLTSGKSSGLSRWCACASRVHHIPYSNITTLLNDIATAPPNHRYHNYLRNMADEDKAKAEKLAAAKKRVEQLKKQKAKKTASKKEKKDDKEEKEDTKETELKDDGTEAETKEELEGNASSAELPKSDTPGVEAETTESAAEDSAMGTPLAEEGEPSLSLQSRLRSASFRQGSAGPGPLSPGGLKSPAILEEGETAHEIHRKQAARIDELEKENKRLAKEASDGERRWRKAEEDLDDLRETDNAPKTANSTDEAQLEKLVSIIGHESDPDIDVHKWQRSEITALQRQNAQLSKSRGHGSSPSVAPAPSDLEAELSSKTSTIESMEIEISNLRAQLDRVASGSSAEKEQISALEDKVSRSQKAAEVAQRELTELKKNLDRTTEKAVKEGGERISAETKLRTLEREAEEAKTHTEDLQKKVEALEKKIITLTTLHKEHDARSQAQKRDREKAEKDAGDMRSKLAHTENENLRMREERERSKKREAQGADDDGVDELESEERLRLEKHIRELEGEVHELRRGVWRDRRQELEGGDGGMTSPGARFTDVDLGSSPARRRSMATGGKTVSDFFSSGFSALTGGSAQDSGALLEDDELDFDEEAFRVAQEEEGRKRIERVKEIKRGLKEWQGWRLDLAESRRGGGEGVGPIFEV